MYCIDKLPKPNKVDDDGSFCSCSRDRVHHTDKPSKTGKVDEDGSFHT